MRKIEIQHGICMPEFTVRSAGQLSAILQGFRKQAGLTQAATAMRLGVTQQTYSALERNADKVNADRLLHLLSILGVELVLRPSAEQPERPTTTDPAW